MTKKILFKNTAYILTATSLFLVTLATLGIPVLLYNVYTSEENMFERKTIFENLYDKFYGEETPQFKVLTNGVIVKIMLKFPLKNWREARTNERSANFFGNRKGGMHGGIQERAMEDLMMVKDYFKKKSYRELKLVSESDLYKSLDGEIDGE